MLVPLDVWITRTVLPLTGVVLAVLLFTLTAVASALELLDVTARLALLGVGACTWMAGLAWGAWVNRRPLPAHAHRVPEQP